MNVSEPHKSRLKEEEEGVDLSKTIVVFEHYALVLLNFILAFCTDKKVKKTDTQKTCHETNACLLSRITFWWINP